MIQVWLKFAITTLVAAASVMVWGLLLAEDFGMVYQIHQQGEILGFANEYLGVFVAGLGFCVSTVACVRLARARRLRAPLLIATPLLLIGLSLISIFWWSSFD